MHSVNKKHRNLLAVAGIDTSQDSKEVHPIVSVMAIRLNVINQRNKVLPLCMNCNFQLLTEEAIQLV